jgi:hypothetical protein
MAQKYNFKIIFKKLEEVKSEQNQIDESDFTISKEISDQIRELKESYEDIAPTEMGTYTRS